MSKLIEKSVGSSKAVPSWRVWVSKNHERNMKANKKSWPYQRLTRTHAVFFSYLFARLNISPNTITLLMLLPAFIGSYLFISISLYSDIMALLCFHLVLVLDQADGEVARVMDKRSRHGVFLDRVMHMIIHPIIFLSISYHYYVLENNLFILILGFVYVCSDYIKGTIESVFHSVMTIESNSNQSEISTHSKANNDSSSNPISYLSGLYARNFYKTENGWFFIILTYPFDFYFNYQVMGLSLCAFTVCVFFTFQTIYTLKKLIVISYRSAGTMINHHKI